MTVARRRAVLLLSFLGVLGCTRPQTVVPLALDGAPKVLVLPFGLGGVLGVDGSFVAQGGATPLPDDLAAGAAGLLASDLVGLGVTQVYAVTGAGATHDAIAAARSGREAGANLVVIGAVLRFREREGPALGASLPASVAYQVDLVRAADGAIVTVEDFDYTQQTLSSNVLELPKFLEGGGRWVTRQEMLDGALKETARHLAAVIRGEAPPKPPKRPGA